MNRMLVLGKSNDLKGRKNGQEAAEMVAETVVAVKNGYIGHKHQSPLEYHKNSKKYRSRGDISPQGNKAAVERIPRCLKNRGNRTPGDNSLQSENAAVRQMHRWLKKQEPDPAEGGPARQGSCCCANAQVSKEQETGGKERP